MFRRNQFEAHALVHHKHYAEIFSDEPVARGEDKEIRLTVRKAPIKAIPIAALIALVSWQGAAVFVAAMMFHHWAWNQIHLAGTSMLRSLWLTMFLALAFGPTKVI